MKRVGVLGIHGSVEEHEAKLVEIGVEPVRVRTAADLHGIDGIILPGGESTTLSKLMRRCNLFEPLQELIADGLPAWGTCAGAILLATEVTGKNPPETLGLMDIAADRNAYGSQNDSFVAEVAVHLHGKKAEEAEAQSQKIEAIFIRAPKLRPTSDEVQVLATHNEQPILLQQGHLLASSFHPELTKSQSLHRFFCNAFVKKQ